MGKISKIISELKRISLTEDMRLRLDRETFNMNKQLNIETSKMISNLTNVMAQYEDYLKKMNNQIEPEKSHEASASERKV
jgi:hypothetical protein